jgi:hypothetical protein
MAERKTKEERREAERKAYEQKRMAERKLKKKEGRLKEKPTSRRGWPSRKLKKKEREAERKAYEKRITEQKTDQDKKEAERKACLEDLKNMMEEMLRDRQDKTGWPKRDNCLPRSNRGQSRKV